MRRTYAIDEATLNAPNNRPVSSSSFFPTSSFASTPCSLPGPSPSAFLFLLTYSSSASACTAGLNPPPKLRIMPEMTNMSGVGNRAIRE